MKSESSWRSNGGFTVVVETVENNFLDCALATVTDSKLSPELNWIARSNMFLV